MARTSGFRTLDGVQGTTLVAPCAWTILALASVVGVEWAAWQFPWRDRPDWLTALRYAAATATLCPTLAVMGAKRPQNRGWQFVVLTLWIILQIPSVQWLLAQPGGALVIPIAWSLFVWGLLALEIVNYGATRFWPSSFLVLAGQVALTGPFLPWPALGGHGGSTISKHSLAALALFALALLLIVLGLPRSRATVQKIDRLWLDFRDRFGTFWSMRLLVRLNSLATMYGWPLQLRWNGFHFEEGVLEEDAGESTKRADDTVIKSLGALLRRFVSRAWIARRLEDPAPEPDRT